jgi:heterodisulfide reductase subunit C
MEIAFTLFQVLCFLGLLTFFGAMLAQRIGFLRRNILLGKPTGGISEESKSERMRRTLLLAFGQRKMFDKPFVGAMHFVIYAAFLIINVEVLEIVLDGITGQHRLFSNLLGGLYPWLIGFFELMAFGVVAACVVFWLRRNVLRLPRFTKPEMEGFPTSDANTILVWESVLMMLLFTMNAADSVLQLRAAESAFVAAHYPQVGQFAISQLLMPLFEGFGTPTLIWLERGAWWAHIAGILGFAVYVTYSKHLHILLAFPNTYYADLRPKGEMENMPAVTKEVKIMMGTLQDDGGSDETPSFGASDVQDLSWKNLMDAYSCTECGRCTSECPANQTGKKLSPRKIMMDTRDRLEEVGHGIDLARGVWEGDGKKLYGDYISKEEIMACTTCNACVEACPVSISPLDIILKMRRYIAMEESDTPQSWNAVFQNIENNFAPWAFSASDRFNWADELAAEQEGK